MIVMIFCRPPFHSQNPSSERPDGTLDPQLTIARNIEGVAILGFAAAVVGRRLWSLSLVSRGVSI